MRSRSKKWESAKDMPPLRHSIPGKEFDIEKSEVAQWLTRRPDIMQLIFEAVKNKEIVYDGQTGMWRGVDYDN